MSFKKDALLHKTQEENDKLGERLQSWIDVDRLDKVPTYIEDRDLRNERTRYMLDREQYKATIDKIKKEMQWFENFAGAMYKLDKDMYDKASKIAYEMLKVKKEKK